ncbi:hypothetical protein C8J25_11123 [Sphingomonas faeni]|uniref:Uncharacterized protein n=1 Tax=Sphingomonas faeni TaxID=185950 RepID=A0A2T5TY46_9SPHN|nr:hypothetical protein C8J25_11123 [Sphingomonas faeni]
MARFALRGRVIVYFSSVWTFGHAAQTGKDVGARNARGVPRGIRAGNGFITDKDNGLGLRGGVSRRTCFRRYLEVGVSNTD